MVGLSKEQLLKKRQHKQNMAEIAHGVKPKYDSAILSKQILEWVDRDDSMSMAQFCVEFKIVPQMIWEYDKTYPDFHEAYELTRLTLAVRRETMLNCESLNYGAWMKSASMYDTFIRRHEEEIADRDADRRLGLAKEERLNLVELAKLCMDGTISQK
jgi:hypothetical protein